MNYFKVCQLLKQVVLLSLAFFTFLGIQLLLPQISHAETNDTWVEKVVKAGEFVGSTAIGAGKTAAGDALKLGAGAGSTVLEAGTGIAKTAVQVGGVVGGVTLEAGKAATDTAVHVGGTVGGVALQAGKTAAGTVVQVGGAVEGTALQVGKVAVGTTAQVGIAVGNATLQIGELAAKETYQLMGQAVGGIKYASEVLAQAISQSFNSQVLPLLDVVIDEIDTDQIKTQTHQWQRTHLEQTPGQVADHFIWNHARKSLLPSDWVTTVRMQAEMVYEIASAYGLDLDDPARKAEIISLATVNLGSGPTIKAGIGLLRYPVSQIPLAGDVVDIGSDSMLRFAMVHILGHAACHYYETNVGAPTPGRIALSSQPSS